MITLSHINKHYGANEAASFGIHDINLQIDQGEFVGVVGKSGSGKSTLLNMIGGIDRPSSGSVSVLGESIANMREQELAIWRGKTVGFVFQFFQLLPTLTAVENVTLPMDFRGKLSVQRRRKQALELLERVGIQKHAEKLPSQLSGGEQQRVAIARALANDPPLVLADEPTGNLDSTTAKEVLELFVTMVQAGKTVVMVTHEPDIARLVNRRILLVDGSLKHEEQTVRE